MAAGADIPARVVQLIFEIRHGQYMYHLNTQVEAVLAGCHIFQQIC